MRLNEVFKVRHSKKKITRKHSTLKYILFYNALHKNIFTQESTCVVISALMCEDTYIKDIFEMMH